MSDKRRILFISHSSYDKDYVSLLVDLLRKQGLGKDDIFCSSYPGYGVPGGQSIFDFLRSRLIDYDPYVLFVISKENYYSSPACLNEMGAAWALGTKSNAILLPGTRPSDLIGAIGRDFLSIVLDGDDAKYRLTELKEDVLMFLNTKANAMAAWEYDRDLFLKECSAISKTKRPAYLKGADIDRYLDDLVDRRVPVSQSLRRALSVARRSENEEDAEWISSELSGYSDKECIPEYRGVHSASFRYSGISGNMNVSNAMLPLHYLDEETLDMVSSSEVADGIESIEKMVESNTQVTRDLSVLIPVIFKTTGGFCQCSEVVQIVPPSTMTKIITSVEDRLMQFFINRLS